MSDDIKKSIEQLAKQAKEASRKLATLPTDTKNKILNLMAENLITHQEKILTENTKDMETAKKNNLTAALLDRLLLTPERINAMAAGLRQVSELPDPINSVLEEINKPNGLVIKKVRVPIGVITVIYESRPNVTADVAGLCFKAGNSIILRGGKEAFHTNHAIINALLVNTEQTGLPPHSIQLIPTTDHSAVTALVQCDEYIDVVIPRGGEKLIEAVVSQARVPVLKHFKGLCHTYVDNSADLTKAVAICENAKCQRPGVCNAMETLLIHRDIAPTFLPEIIETFKKHNVECRGDEAAQKIIPYIKPATEEDWHTEYLDLIISIRIVDNTNDAINHINTYGSHHSDAILSEDKEAQQQFTSQVDSSSVYVNASTRFTDGYEFGMGAEIGISTDKLHARGPMGLNELTTYKYVILGSGQIRN